MLFSIEVPVYFIAGKPIAEAPPVCRPFLIVVRIYEGSDYGAEYGGQYQSLHKRVRHYSIRKTRYTIVHPQLRASITTNVNLPQLLAKIGVASRGEAAAAALHRGRRGLIRARTASRSRTGASSGIQWLTPSRVTNR